MKYYLIVGEASGDLHASHLMQSLKQRDEAAEFRFIGGDLMAAVGGTRVRHYRDLAYMGFVPVLRKYKYELEKKAKEAKKKQKVVEIKEVKVRYKIDTHDYEVRLKNIRKFISQGYKVKLVVMLRGREMQHSGLAVELAERFIADLANDLTVEKKPVVEGRNVVAWFAP